MTPAYLNPSPFPFPFVELKEDQHLERFSPPHQAPSSLSSPFLFKLPQDQRGCYPRESRQNLQQVEKYVLHGGSSAGHVIQSSSLQKRAADDNQGNEIFVCKKEDGKESKSDDGSMKWMSSKMRLMRKWMNSNCSRTTDKPERFVHKFDDQQQHNSEVNSFYNSNDTVRVCSDCNTTKTPLWRSGPRGPKSLCNACGIRQRKARRAMAKAAAAAATAANSADFGSNTSTSFEVHNKENKSHSSYVTQHKRHCKLPCSAHSGKKLNFEDFSLRSSENSNFQNEFPRDEEEAAILLMALSCGLIHSR